MRHTNKRLKKSPTSSTVEGPPILRNTIAVGPFEPTEFCVTGGTGVANDLVCNQVLFKNRLTVAGPAALRESCATECRVAMLNEFYYL